MNKAVLLRIAAGVLVLALAVMGFLAFGPGRPTTDAQAAVDIPLAYFDGSTGSLADFRGRPVVLNFWASWCPACVAELPDFQQVHTELGDEVVFIGINMQEEDKVAAEALIARSGVAFLLADDPDGAIFRSFNGFGMPTSVFITADGVVADTHSGVIVADDLRAKIREELGVP
jgi:thiol-disulfide isomerase/thioredoxin